MVVVPLLLAFGVMAPSCAALTPGRVNASADTPARGSCDTFTPDPVDAGPLVAPDDRPPVHNVDDGVPFTAGGGAALMDDGVPGGVESVELGAGTGFGKGRSWSGVSTLGVRVAGVEVLGCGALSCAITAVAVHEITTPYMKRAAFFMTKLRSVRNAWDIAGQVQHRDQTWDGCGTELGNPRYTGAPPEERRRNDLTASAVILCIAPVFGFLEVTT